MSFLTPFFLVGGLAIAGPIIFHLVRRATRERTVFSSLMFLLPSPPRLSKRHRFEHLLLLLLRCLALALLAFGFARPFLRQAPIDDPTVAQPKRVVVLVDTSASMRRDGVWTAARDRVAEVLRRAGPADQFAVYPFDRQATALVSFEDWNRTAPSDRVAFAIGRLGGVTPGWAGTHLGNALVTAAEALAETEGKTAPGPRQIVLVSDMQSGSRLETLQAYEWPKGVELVLEPIAARNPTNAGVQLVAESAESNRPVDAPVRVRVTNSPDSKREQFKLSWARAAAQPGAAPEPFGAEIPAYVPPGQSRVFNLPQQKGPADNAIVALRGDDEPFDNLAYVIPPAQQRANVLWIGSDVAEDPKQPLFFLRRAFAETPRVAVQVTAVAPNAALSPTDLNAANAIFLADALPGETAAALRAQVLAGKLLVVVARSPAVGPTLGTLVGREGLAMEEGKASNYAMFGEIDFQHPLFAPFADPRFSDFTKIHVWRYRRLDAAAIPGARVVAKFDNGDPALVEVPADKGKIFVLTTGWQPDDSQLAVSSKFVPLMWSLLELTGSIGRVTTQYTVGEKVGGEVRTQPGIYAVTEAGRAFRAAVNLDPSETRTAALGPDELEQLGVPLAKPKTETAQPVENKTFLQGIEAENRQKLWRWFIAATLAVLLVESALAGWTARRERTEAVQS